MPLNLKQNMAVAPADAGAIDNNIASFISSECPFLSLSVTEPQYNVVKAGKQWRGRSPVPATHLLFHGVECHIANSVARLLKTVLGPPAGWLKPCKHARIHEVLLR
jgi:hypothetical protein